MHKDARRRIAAHCSATGLPVALELLERGAELVCIRRGTLGHHIGDRAVVVPARRAARRSRRSTRDGGGKRRILLALGREDDDDRTGPRGVPCIDVPCRGCCPCVSAGHGHAPNMACPPPPRGEPHRMAASQRRITCAPRRRNCGIGPTLQPSNLPLATAPRLKSTTVLD